MALDKQDMILLGVGVAALFIWSRWQGANQLGNPNCIGDGCTDYFGNPDTDPYGFAGTGAPGAGASIAPSDVPYWQVQGGTDPLYGYFYNIGR